MNLQSLLSLLLTFGVFCLCWSSARLWYWAWGRWLLGQPWLEFEPRRETPWSWTEVLFGLVVVILLPGLAVSIIRPWLPPSARPAEQTAPHTPLLAPQAADAVPRRHDSHASAPASATTASTASGNASTQPDVTPQKQSEADGNGLTLMAGSEDERLVELNPLQMFVASLASLVACLISIGWVLFRTDADRGSDLGLTLARAQSDIKLGLVAFVMLAPVVYAIQFVLVLWFPSRHPLTTMFLRNPSWSVFLLAGFAAVLVAPLVEEFLFRVLLQGWLEKVGRQLLPNAVRASGSTPSSPVARHQASLEARRGMDREKLERPSESLAVISNTGPLADRIEPPPGSSLPDSDDPILVTTQTQAHPPPRWPLIATSLLFAGLHGTHGPDPIPLFVFSIGLGYLYERTHRILPSLILHATLNSTSVAVLGIALLTGEAPTSD